MFNLDQLRTQMSRRYFFGQSATGLGAAALGSVLNPQLFGATPNANDGLVRHARCTTHRKPSG